MVMTDPIADMLTRIRNAGNQKALVEVPHSKIKKEILRVLKEEGYIKDFNETSQNNQKILQIHLVVSSGNRRIINGIRKISKPGLRVFTSKKNIPEVLNGYGLAILTTPKGILSNRAAKEMGVGGEVICYIW